MVPARYILRLLRTPRPTLVSMSCRPSDSHSSWFLICRCLLHTFRVPDTELAEGARPLPGRSSPFWVAAVRQMTVTVRGTR